ncbi:MAG: DPP IV N-terminal domain-containing protein, partial [Anaerolineae bacterium]
AAISLSVRLKCTWNRARNSVSSGIGPLGAWGIRRVFFIPFRMLKFGQSDKVVLMSPFVLVLLCCCLIPGLVIVVSQLHGISFQGKIAVQGEMPYDAGIFLYDRIFHTLKRITPQNMLAFSPAWSPDGTRIAFVFSDRDRKEYHVATIDVDSGKIEGLIDKGIDDFSFNDNTAIAWSPDGTQLLLDGTRLFPGSVAGGCHALFLYQFDQKAVRPLNIQFCQSKTGDDVYRLALSWFPGDVPLIGVSSTSSLGYTDDIYMLDQGLTKPEWITLGGYPVWRPGTKDFSFMCEHPGPVFPNSICLYSMQGGTTTKIVKDYNEDKYTWSPDGQTILYVEGPYKERDPIILTLANIASGDKYQLALLETIMPDNLLYCSWFNGSAIWSAK